MATMLVLAPHTLPPSDLTYAAFRLALLDTRERLELAHQLDLNPDRNFGFLTEVPFLRNVPAQVQIDLLLLTWSRHADRRRHFASLIDESVVYSVCETAARMIRTEPEIARRFLTRGPQVWPGLLDGRTADALQRLHLGFARDGLFLMLSQFQDIPPQEAVPLKEKYGIRDAACECLFDVLGRWYASPEILTRTGGLLTRVETEQLGSLLSASGCCPT